MQLNIHRDFFHKIGSKESFTKIFKILFYLENRDRRIYKVLYNQENRIRMLEGKAQITEQQFLTAIDNLDQIKKQDFITTLKGL